jgi:drug/metabolite transporter (DMT)-like permease
MIARLLPSQIALLVVYAVALAGGQLLFKMAAMRSATDGPLSERITGSLLNGYFAAAIVLYAVLTVLWVWILSFTPLSRAYPFVALAFALTPALGAMMFSEPVSMRLVIGIVLILGGLLFVAE